MRPITSVEGKIIRKRLQGIMENFDNMDRKALSKTLFKISEFCYPREERKQDSLGD